MTRRAISPRLAARTFLKRAMKGAHVIHINMEVATIMSTVLVTASPTLPARRLVELLVDENIGAIPIVDDDSVPLGIVTRYDVIEEDEVDVRDDVPACE